MKIIKRINTNAAIALDSMGNEVVILGKGVGFPQVPYELDDLSRIERSFYDINPIYISAFSTIPQEIIAVCGEIMEMAEMVLECDLNPNFPVTLADHINFAVERKNACESGPAVPLTQDVEFLYPKEYKLALKALAILKKRTGHSLPEAEATNITLHIINAESEVDNMHSIMMRTQIVSEIYCIIEKYFGIVLHKEGFQCSRFCMHLLFLVQRLEKNTQMEDDMGRVLWQMAREYPKNYACTQRIVAYFSEQWGWDLNQNEILYLFIHVNRVISSLSGQQGSGDCR